MSKSRSLPLWIIAVGVTFVAGVLLACIVGIVLWLLTPDPPRQTFPKLKSGMKYEDWERERQKTQPAR